jgi:hypothetical protein
MVRPDGPMKKGDRTCVLYADAPIQQALMPVLMITLMTIPIPMTMLTRMCRQMRTPIRVKARAMGTLTGPVIMSPSMAAAIFITAPVRPACLCPA